MSGPRDWPDGQSSNTPSSASSFGFDVAAELARMNHPTARSERTAQSPGARPVRPVNVVRADLIALPPEGEQVGASADRRRHDDRSRPTAAAVGAASSTQSAGARRGFVALAIRFVLGFVVGRRT